MKSALIAICVTLLLNAGLSSAQAPVPTPVTIKATYLPSTVTVARLVRQVNTLKAEMACFQGAKVLPITTKVLEDGSIQLYQGQGSDPVDYVSTVKKECVG